MNLAIRYTTNKLQKNYYRSLLRNNKNSKNYKSKLLYNSNNRGNQMKSIPTAYVKMSIVDSIRHHCCED